MTGNVEYHASGKESNAIAYILIFFGVVAIAIYFLLKAPFKAVSDAVTGAAAAGYNQVSGKNAAMAIDTSLNIDKTGNAYQDWLNYHSGKPVMNPDTGVIAPAIAPILVPLIKLGNAITPSDILANEAVAGQEFSYELAASRDVQRYNELNPISKGFVTAGQAIGSLFGIDLYKAGQGK